MTKSSFDSRLEDWQDPDEPIAAAFWERRRQGRAHTAARVRPPQEPEYEAHYENPLCPDFSSHEENVGDLMFPGRTGGLNPEENDRFRAAVEADYRACEGHW
jgi:hypothetical protein